MKVCEEESLDEVVHYYENYTMGSSRKVSLKSRKTEDVLNAKDIWITGQGEVLYLAKMDKDHLRNILNFLYRRRDFYWFNVRDTSLIDEFEDADDFFKRVIRVSTLWHTLTTLLNEEEVKGFNFDIEDRG